jgi:hypothetical protein
MREEEWKDFYEDVYDDYYDYWYDYYPHYYPGPYYTTTVFVNLSCVQSVVIINGHTYYTCGNVWYDRTYHQNEIHYIQVPAPTGGEIKEIKNAKKVMVGEKIYYISNDNFYELAKKDGKSVYVAVDPPLGVEVVKLPEGTAKIKVGDTTYYQYGRVFYRKLDDPKKTAYVIVKPPF